jgi:hypothetical protein
MLDRRSLPSEADTQERLRKHPDLPDVPLVMDLSSDPKVKAALKLIFSHQAMARPFGRAGGSST